MTTWNDRLLPYPLLAPWTNDYGDATFVANVPHVVLNNGKNINLTIKYHNTSQALRDLISERRAKYVVVVTCRKTSLRRSWDGNDEEDIQILDATLYAGELRLTPYVVASEPIQRFISTEHAQEFRDSRPQGFDISPGAILAVGDSTNITLEDGGSPFSVIDLVPDPNISQGSFRVVLDDNRIKIHVAKRDKESIEVLRKQGEHSPERASLFPALYLHAVTEALHNLAEHADTHWAYTMRKALDRHKITDDDESLKFNALRHAQTLMEFPIGTLLRAFVSGEER